MAEAILRTKLFAPRLRPEFVDRPELVDRLRAGESGKLALITGPAGFGKTSLAARWLEETDRPGVWLSLDERDNDLIQFFTYLSATAQEIDGVGRSTQALLESAPSHPMAALATAFLNDCVAAETPFVLVLDDYHVIKRATIHDAVSFLLDNLPPHLHLAITSRTEPLLPLSRLRASGHMTEIRAADLRFDRTEAAMFIEQMTGHRLSDDQVIALDRRVEGWPAGLQMVAISIAGLRQPSKISDLIENFAASRRYIFDYLVDEVLDQLTPEIQTFLLQTSLLERLNPALCDAVTEQDRSFEVLRDLEQRNLFLFPLAQDRSWFRYHHLFAELLRQRLMRADPGIIDELHRRASLWHEDNDQPDEAVHHALAGHDEDRAARLSERYCTVWLGQSNVHKTKRCLEKLPPAHIELRPQLGILDAWTLVLTNDLDRATARLQDARERLRAVVSNPELVNEWALPDPEKDLARMEGEIATCEAVLARANGDADEMIANLNHALSVLPDDATAQRATALLYLGFANWMAGNGEAALADFTAAIESGGAAGRLYTVLSANSARGRLHLERGELREAEAYFRAAFRAAEQHAATTGVLPPIVAEARTGLARLALERNDLPTARTQLEQAIRELEPLGVTEDWIDAGLVLAELLRVEADHAAANDLLHALNSAIEGADAAPILRRRVRTHEMGVQLRDRSLDRARLGDAINQHVDAGGNGQDKPITYLQEEELLVLARWHVLGGDVDDALDLLAQLDDATRTAGRLDRLIRVLLVTAQALRARGETDRAATVLAEALDLGEQAGYLRVFLNESDWLVDLLVLPPYSSYRNDLLRHMDEGRRVAPPSPGSSSQRSTQVPADLSDRELEVLRLLSTHLSGPEIAGELYVSINTLKTHTKTIYRKLGVNKRTEAVTKAAAIGLI